MRRLGTSVLFVSHDLDAVVEHASRAVCLEAGRVAAEGDPSTVVAFHRRQVAEPPKPLGEAAV